MGRKLSTSNVGDASPFTKTSLPTKVGHPSLKEWKYPLPGDKDVTMIERVVIDVPTKKLVRFKMPADQHRSTICDDVSCSPGLWDDVRWAADGKSIAFVSTSRDHTQEWFRVANPETGDVRTIFDEKAKTYFEGGNEMANWQYVPETDQVIWFSERSNWGHLYTYSLKTGKLQTQITKGAALTQPVTDGPTDIIAGRRPVSDWDGLIRDYFANGGEQIRNEFMQAIQSAQ